MAKNVHADDDSKIRTRPGYAPGFNVGNDWVTDIGSYAAVLTDSQPRVLAHNRNSNVFLDSGVQVSQVGNGGPGATITPFRPSASPQSWAYVANGTGYRKISAPVTSVEAPFPEI